jgi:hypothetical protein
MSMLNIKRKSSNANLVILTKDTLENIKQTVDQKNKKSPD